MSSYEFTHDIAATPEQVWTLVADHEGMASWLPVRRVTLEREGSPTRNGVGAIRALSPLGVGLALREEVTAFEPGVRLEYRVLSGIPVRDYTGEIRLEPSTVGTHLVWTVSLSPVVPGIQFVVAGVIRVAAAALAKRAAKVGSAR